MRPGMLVLALIGSAALAACGAATVVPPKEAKPPTAQVKKKPRKCPAKVDPCTIEINPADAEGWVEDPVVVYGAHNRDLVFRLAAPYKFESNGIETPEDPPSDAQFSCAAHTPGPGGEDQFKCTLTRKRFDVTKYTIRVRGLAALDPFVVNQ